MDRYQLAKLVSWAGTLNARKRLQKVVYLMQSAGAPLNADYTLHHYGPYSEEVARLADDMVRSSLLAEQSFNNGIGLQYAYSLPEEVQQQLVETEASDRGQLRAQ